MSQNQSPGQMLREARESRKIDAQDAADYLNVSKGKLLAIEHDQYEKLHSETFVRGYLRAYSKYMQIDEALIIRVFEDYVRETRAEAEEAQEPTDSSESKSNLPNWLPIAAVVAAALIWFVVSSSTAEPKSTDTQVSLGVPADAPQFKQRPDQQQDIVTNEIDNPTLEPISETEFPQAERPQTESINVPLESEVKSDVSGVLESDIQTPQPASELIAQTKKDSVAISTESDVASVIDQLRFEFSEDCWLEISDATGTRLFSQVAKQGSELLIEGQAPFDIMLGNVRATRLQLNGSDFELEPQGNRKTLRLTVGS